MEKSAVENLGWMKLCGTSPSGPWCSGISLEPVLGISSMESNCIWKTRCCVKWVESIFDRWTIQVIPLISIMWPLYLLAGSSDRNCPMPRNRWSVSGLDGSSILISGNCEAIRGDAHLLSFSDGKVIRSASVVCAVSSFSYLFWSLWKSWVPMISYGSEFSKGMFHPDEVSSSNLVNSCGILVLVAVLRKPD